MKVSLAWWNALVGTTIIVLAGLINAKNVLILVGDDAGFETSIYGNDVSKTPHLNSLANRGVVFDNAFTSVSSCSPSRSAILSGLPQHQNGMYGLHNQYHHFNSFDQLRSLPKILNDAGIWTGIVGKKHVGPDDVYPFDYAVTEEHYSILQAGRNITFMKEKVEEFFQQKSNNVPFFLYIGFHDPHRCGHTHPQFGSFCEKFGNGDPGMGIIPDWTPYYYKPEEVNVPYFVPDTPVTREDIASQYTTISRLDQGIGLMLHELEKSGHLNDTLIIYTSDNGIPFPSGRTNLYDAGMAEPFIISSPYGQNKWGTRTTSLTSLLDIVPTVLDWFNLDYPIYKIWNHPVRLTGQSLIPLIHDQVRYQERQAIYASHDLHEVTMYYPMRSIRTADFHLIHNLNFRMPFGIDQDFYISPTFQDMLNRTHLHLPLQWYKTLRQYYYRSEWELFDLRTDPKEINNVAENSSYSHIMQWLQTMLNKWQNITADPWICSPGGVLQDEGAYKGKAQCMPLLNGLPSSWNINREINRDSRLFNREKYPQDETFFVDAFESDEGNQSVVQRYVLSMDVTNVIIFLSWFCIVCCYVSYRVGLHHRKRKSNALQV